MSIVSAHGRVAKDVPLDDELRGLVATAKRAARARDAAEIRRREAVRQRRAAIVAMMSRQVTARQIGALLGMSAKAVEQAVHRGKRATSA